MPEPDPKLIESLLQEKPGVDEPPGLPPSKYYAFLGKTPWGHKPKGKSTLKGKKLKAAKVAHHKSRLQKTANLRKFKQAFGVESTAKNAQLTEFFPPAKWSKEEKAAGAKSIQIDNWPASGRLDYHPKEKKWSYSSLGHIGIPSFDSEQEAREAFIQATDQDKVWQSLYIWYHTETAEGPRGTTKKIDPAVKKAWFDKIRAVRKEYRSKKAEFEKKHGPYKDPRMTALAAKFHPFEDAWLDDTTREDLKRINIAQESTQMRTTKKTQKIIEKSAKVTAFEQSVTVAKQALTKANHAFSAALAELKATGDVDPHYAQSSRIEASDILGFIDALEEMQRTFERYAKDAGLLEKFKALKRKVNEVLPRGTGITGNVEAVLEQAAKSDLPKMLQDLKSYRIRFQQKAQKGGLAHHERFLDTLGKVISVADKLKGLCSTALTELVDVQEKEMPRSEARSRPIPADQASLLENLIRTSTVRDAGV